VFDDGTPAPVINRYVRTVTVQVLGARNARLIAERTFQGSDPRACQTYEFLSVIAPSLRGGTGRARGEGPGPPAPAPTPSEAPTPWGPGPRLAPPTASPSRRTAAPASRRSSSP
jgi:hypothetical protein